MPRLVEEVFVTEGVPEFTFVKPPNYGEILIDIRRPGKPVIVEGQSGTGKTTCVNKILDEIGLISRENALTARKAEDVSRIEAIAREPDNGTYVIDDFHRLADGLQSRLGDLAKAAAEQGEHSDLPKLILIGINEVGTELIQLVPDIAKRTGIHRILPGDKSSIGDLIQSGCEKLSVQIEDSDQVFVESKGDYWLTQQLCQSICIMNDVYEEQSELTPLTFDTDELRKRIVERLKSAYYPAVKDFCRGKRFRPTNDPYYKLLKTISEQESSIVDLNQLANSIPEVRGSINNIKERRLGVLLDTKPMSAQHFYYNSDTKNFAIEDPALFYFLRHLNWEDLRIDCGFKPDNTDCEFDIAISFAGENRQLAKHLAEQLGILDTNVFYDEYYEANYLGKTWTAEFQRVFGEDSRMVVCLLDEHHERKIWPTFERECFDPRVKDGSVVPIYLDDTKFLGIPKDVVGIKYEWNVENDNWREDVVDEIVFKLMDKLSTL